MMDEEGLHPSGEPIFKSIAPSRHGREGTPEREQFGPSGGGDPKTERIFLVKIARTGVLVAMEKPVSVETLVPPNQIENEIEGRS